MVAQAGPGKKVAVGIVRDGENLTKRPTLADRDRFLSGIEEEPAAKEEDQDWLGLKVSTSTEDLAAQYNVKFYPGVLAVEVQPGSLGQQAGFRVGDIITRADDREIGNLDEFRNITRSLKEKGKAVLFLVYRGGEPLFIAVKPE